MTTYNELKRKYMLHEITEEEYEQEKRKLIEKLFDMYEERVIGKQDLKDKLKNIED